MQVEIFYGGQQHHRLAAIATAADAHFSGVDRTLRSTLEGRYDLKQQSLNKEGSLPFAEVRQGGLFEDSCGPENLLIWENGQALTQLKNMQRVYAMRTFDLAGRHLKLLIETDERKPQRSWSDALSNLSRTEVTYTDCSPPKGSKAALTKRLVAEAGLADRIQSKGIDELTALCGGDEVQTRAALGVIANNAEPGVIRARAIRALLPTGAASPYAFVDSVLSGDRAMAFRQAQALARSGAWSNSGRLLGAFSQQLHVAALATCCPGDQAFKVQRIGADRQWVLEKAERQFATVPPSRVLLFWRTLLDLEERILSGRAAAMAIELRRLAALAAI